MSWPTQSDIVRIFEELPGHRGCAESTLDAVERQFGDVPVFEFNYYSSENHWLPKECSPSVPTFIVDRIRTYLQL